MKPSQAGDEKMLVFPDGDRGYRYCCFRVDASCEAGSSVLRADSGYNYCYEWVPAGVVRP
jgi:hypothetical protein